MAICRSTPRWYRMYATSRLIATTTLAIMTVAGTGCLLVHLIPRSKNGVGRALIGLPTR